MKSEHSLMSSLKVSVHKNKHPEQKKQATLQQWQARTRTCETEQAQASQREGAEEPEGQFGREH